MKPLGKSWRYPDDICLNFSHARRHEKTGQLIRNYEHVVPLQLFIVHNKLIIKEIKFTALNMD